MVVMVQPMMVVVLMVVMMFVFVMVMMLVAVMFARQVRGACFVMVVFVFHILIVFLFVFHFAKLRTFSDMGTSPLLVSVFYSQGLKFKV